MKKHIFLALFAFASSQITIAQTKLVEKVIKKGNELVIPFEKYKLPNGLTLIIHEDHSDPIVHVDVTYHVGSAREEIGKSGFAHFFEHMMFQGSDHVKDEEHFKLVTEAGGTMNGTTNRDRTNYFETIPSNQLERALWLEADRMGFLLDAVTQQKFEVQRATVKNEKGQNYDNRPYAAGAEYVARTLYPYGHPYSWLTIGYVEDLNRVEVSDLKNFFLRWYGPNNATLTIGGDVNPKEVIKLVEKYFGSIPKGPAVSPTVLAPFSINKDRYVSYEDNIRFPMLQMVFPTVPSFHKDEPALDVLAEILGGGATSLFYKNFVKAQKGIQAGVYNSTSELSGEFTMTVLGLPNTPLSQLEQMVRLTLEEFEKRGVTDDDLKQFKARYESNVVKSLSSVSGKASQLAHCQTLGGDANLLTKEHKAVLAVTKEDVLRVYQQYLKGKYGVILSVYPKGKKELIAAPDNYTASHEKYQAPDYGYKGLKYVKAKDTFDRSKKPDAGANPTLKIPAFWKEKFANGIKVIGSYSNEIPSVTLSFSIKGGHTISATDLSKVGVVPLTVAMMNEATQKHTTEQLDGMLRKLGSSVSFNAGAEAIYVQVSSLTKNLDETLAILQEKLFEPKFAPEDFERLKKQQLEGIANQSTQPSAIADKAYSKILFGSESIQSYPLSGTVETVKNVTLEDIKALYKQYFAPNVTSLVVVGDMTEKEFLPKIQFLENWKSKTLNLPKIAPKPNTLKPTLYLVDKEKAPQSEIRIGYLTDFAYTPVGTYYAAEVMNYVLGGAFNSRINLNLREEKGYTYGARSGFGNSRIASNFTAQASVKAMATDSSIVEFIKEIKQYADKGITDEELTFTKKSIGQSDALKYETQAQKASFLGLVLEFEEMGDFAEKRKQLLTSLSASEINVLAKKYLPYNNMIIVVVGDKKSLKPSLERLGYPIIELDK